MDKMKKEDHIQFLITEIGAPNSSAKAARDFERELNDDFELVASVPLISPQIFCQVFPFHLMFGE